MSDGIRSDAPTHVEISARTFSRAAVAVVFTLIGLWLLRELATVLLLITVSLIVTAVLSGLATRLERRGVSHGLAAMLSVLSVIIVAGGLAVIVLPPLIREVTSLIENLPEITRNLQQRLAGNPTIFRALEHEAQQLRSNPSGVVSGALKVGASVASLIFAVAMILTLSLYFLTDGDRVYRTVIRFTPQKYRDRMAETIHEAGRLVRAYFTGQALISGIFGTLTFITLTVLGIKYALVIAVIAFFLDSIPNMGATIATVLTVLVVLPQSVTSALIVLGVFLVYQQIENNMISPRIMSSKLDIPPILTLLMVLAGGKVMGAVGVIIAIPLAGLLPVLDRIWIRGDTKQSEPPLTGTGRSEAAA